MTRMVDFVRSGIVTKSATKDNAVAGFSLGWSCERGVGVSELDISVLGSPRIEVDGAPLQVDTRKATALLAYLATTGRPQSRDRLVGLLWPDYDEEKARGALRRTLSTLKKALGGRWVTADRSTVTLDLADAGFDLGTLRGALELVASHGHDPETDCAECLMALTRAAEVAGGEFLQGFSLRDAEPFDEWRSLEAYSVTRELTRVLDMLVHSHTSAGNLGAAVDAARRKLDLDPLDEPTHRQLMQLNAWRGMRGAALEQYRECVAVLDRELGVPPLPETTALYDTIAEGEVETRETPRLKEPGARRPARAPAGYPLRGRTAEMDGLLELYSRLGDAGALVSIQGEAGIGKTRLAEEFLDAVTERGAPSLSARGHEGESGLPYALITQLLERVADRLPSSVPQGALTEASRLLPSLSPDAVPGPIDDPGATGRFFEGIREVLTASLAGSQPGVLFADDLQWCDSASLEVLTYLARRLDETPILLLPSWRTEEIDRSHPLNHLVAAAERNSSVQLERLKEEDVRALVDDATENTGAEVGDLAHRLMVETEGIPFFIVEYLAVAGEGEGDWRLPQSIKELLRSRAELVGETSRQILGTAAVIDRSFDFDTVWKASGRTEFETVDAPGRTSGAPPRRARGADRVDGSDLRVLPREAAHLHLWRDEPGAPPGASSTGRRGPAHRRGTRRSCHLSVRTGSTASRARRTREGSRPTARASGRLRAHHLGEHRGPRPLPRRAGPRSPESLGAP